MQQVGGQRMLSSTWRCLVAVRLSSSEQSEICDRFEAGESRRSIARSYWSFADGGAGPDLVDGRNAAGVGGVVV